MKKIAITGHTGFLGRNIIDRFRNDDVLLIERDLKNIEDVLKFKPDHIFHFGAEIYDDSKMLDSNILMTYNLLERTKNIDYKSFIYCGSSSEYGKKEKPMSEDDVLEPRTMYEATKGAGTLLCQSYATTHNKPIAIVRPFSVYGRYEKEHRFIPTLFRKFINSEQIKIAPGYHDFIHVDDFVDCVLEVALSEKSKIIGEIVNIGTGKQYSNYEVYEIFKGIFGYGIEAEKTETPMRIFDTNNWIANIDKAKEKFNFSPKYDLSEGINQIYNERFNR